MAARAAFLHVGHVALRARPAAADPVLEAAPHVAVAVFEVPVLRDEELDAAASVGVHEVRLYSRVQT